MTGESGKREAGLEPMEVYVIVVVECRRTGICGRPEGGWQVEEDDEGEMAWMEHARGERKKTKRQAQIGIGGRPKGQPASQPGVKVEHDRVRKAGRRVFHL